MILLRSNLVRETLGKLWALCNKATPGQLIKEELYLLLAMISVAQVTITGFPCIVEHMESDYKFISQAWKCPGILQNQEMS